MAQHSLQLFFILLCLLFLNIGHVFSILFFSGRTIWPSNTFDPVAPPLFLSLRISEVTQKKCRRDSQLWYFLSFASFWLISERNIFVSSESMHSSPHKEDLNQPVSSSNKDHPLSRVCSAALRRLLDFIGMYISFLDIGNPVFLDVWWRFTDLDFPSQPALARTRGLVYFFVVFKVILIPNSKRTGISGAKEHPAQTQLNSIDKTVTNKECLLFFPYQLFEDPCNPDLHELRAQVANKFFSHYIVFSVQRCAIFSPKWIGIRAKGNLWLPLNLN